MALPMNNMPMFTLIVPSTNKPAKYRPFLVKDEKALMIAQQSEDIGVMVDTLKEVVKSCLVDSIDVDSLATFDLEYIFTQIRGKSVGEKIELLFACDTDHGEQNEKAVTKITIDISNLEVKKDPSHTNKINLFQDVGVVMKYPTLEVAKKLEGNDLGDIDGIFDVISESIDFIYQGEDIYYAKDQSREELLQFLNNLTSDQFIRIQKFFETMPKLSKEVEYTCPICGKEHKKLLEGLQSFF
jgi:hypothetical protein